ncbi:MAG: addiction module protein [Bacteroidia bacterium]|nr:addiction module protein [Bacteroidia bacterium]
MSDNQQTILNTIYTRLTASERFHLALILLSDFDPDDSIAEIPDTFKAEYRSRKQAFLDGKLTARP